MACCILLFGLIALFTWPLRKLGFMKTRPSPLAWQPSLASGPYKAGQDNELKLSGKRFSWRARVKSFHYAFAGLRHVIEREHNARIHIAASLLVIAAGIYFHVSPRDFAVLILVIMAVCFAETLNTAFEHLCDVVSPEKNQSVKFAKDIAAGAVLICTIGAALVGLIIFMPYITGNTSPYDFLCRS